MSEEHLRHLLVRLHAEMLNSGNFDLGMLISEQLFQSPHMTAGLRSLGSGLSPQLYVVVWKD